MKNSDKPSAKKMPPMKPARMSKKQANKKGMDKSPAKKQVEMTGREVKIVIEEKQFS